MTVELTKRVPTEIVVEIGNSHEGSLGIAKSFVDMAKAAGAKTVKFQMHIPEAEGRPDEPFRVKFSDQDKTRQDYWARINFSVEDWITLAKYCHAISMEFLCTPFSVEAAEILFDNNLVRRWKIGSGQAVDWPLIDYVARTGLPLIISTGLVNEYEISLLNQRLTGLGMIENLTLLHCVSQYPAPINQLDLHLIDDLRKFAKRVGFSDHSGNIHTAIYAIALGADLIEVHMAPHKKFFGPDVSSSLIPEEIAELIEFSETVNVLAVATGTKEDHYSRVEPLRKIFRKGIYWKRTKQIGEKIGLDDFSILKPVSEIDVVDIDKIIGKRVTVPVVANTAVKWDEFE
jgi:N,N'-diacetyllegionaminate synthase